MKKNKTKIVHLTRKEIKAATAAGDYAVLANLAEKQLEGADLTVSEAEAAALMLVNSGLEGSICKFDLATIPGAQDARFINLYITYADDLEGERGITKFSGNDGLVSRLVSREEKAEDVIRLNEYYTAWNEHFNPARLNKHKDQLLNLVINEVNKEGIKAIDKEKSDGIINIKEYEYKRKSTVLHSKFLYLRVKRIIQDLQEKDLVMNFKGTSIEITDWSLVHIFNRHYASKIKQYNTGKSYHADESLRFFEDPESLTLFIEKIGSHPEAIDCDIRNVYFKLNGIIYALHSEEQIRHLGGKKIHHTRLQSFYPLEDSSILKNLSDNYTEFTVDFNLSGYKPTNPPPKTTGVVVVE